MALPSIAARGCWAEAEDKIARAIANCPETWDFLGVEDEAAAIAGNMFLHAFDPPEDGESYRGDEWQRMIPAIIIATPGDEGGAFRYFRRSSPNDFGAQGIVELRFYQWPKVDEEVTNQERLFINSVGVLLEQLTDRGDESGYLFFREADLQQFAREPPEDHQELGHFFGAIFTVPWGDTEGEE